MDSEQQELIETYEMIYKDIAQYVAVFNETIEEQEKCIANLTRQYVNFKNFGEYIDRIETIFNMSDDGPDSEDEYYATFKLIEYDSLLIGKKIDDDEKVQLFFSILDYSTQPLEDKINYARRVFGKPIPDLRQNCNGLYCDSGIEVYDCDFIQKQLFHNIVDMCFLGNNEPIDPIGNVMNIMISDGYKLDSVCYYKKCKYNNDGIEAERYPITTAILFEIIYGVDFGFNDEFYVNCVKTLLCNVDTFVTGISPDENYEESESLMKQRIFEQFSKFI